MQAAQHILLVDDERFARQLYADYLRVAGHDVETAESAEAALEALSRGRFDLVITDMVLPGEDGLALLSRVKALDPDCGVIVITALQHVDPAVRAIKSGADDYLVKPVTPEALQLAVSRATSTRLLLREHAQLKRGLALLESCRRLLTAGDPTRLPGEIASALRTETSAAAVVVQDVAGARPLGFAGAIEAEALAIGAALPAGAEGPLRLASVPHLPRDWEQAVVLPLPAEGGPVARAVLVGPAARFDAEALERARFVAQNAGLALANATRLASARDLAYVDDLTGLYNARYVDAILDRELQEAAGNGATFALLFLDLDLFKKVNDVHGHLVGSRLLVECAKVIRSCVREEDVASRWGGDEFVVLLRGSDSGGALKVAERIRRAIEEHAFLAREGLRLRLTTCVGVAAFPEHATDKAQLLDLADRAMYRGKGSTRLRLRGNPTAGQVSMTAPRADRSRQPWTTRPRGRTARSPATSASATRWSAAAGPPAPRAPRPAPAARHRPSPPSRPPRRWHRPAGAASSPRCPRSPPPASDRGSRAGARTAPRAPSPRSSRARSPGSPPGCRSRRCGRRRG